MPKIRFSKMFAFLRKKPSNYGLKLRKKSKVHASIIDEKTGRRKIESTAWVEDMLKERKEKWISVGNQIFPKVEKSIRQDLVYLKNKKMPDIFVLGPGEGAEVVFINELLQKNLPKIDTLSITNQLSKEANKIIRKDYSSNPKTLSKKDLFENFNHLKFVKKYDYIFTNMGPLEHTRFQEIAILKLASMLRPGGLARVIPAISLDCIKNIKEYLKQKGKENDLSFENSVYDGQLLIKRIK
jgi:hypothetical protein